MSLTAQSEGPGSYDLCHMLGLPSKVKCPRCRRVVNSCWDEYDIEEGHSNPSPGAWSLSTHCSECGHTWYVEFHVTWKVVAAVL